MINLEGVEITTVDEKPAASASSSRKQLMKSADIPENGETASRRIGRHPKDGHLNGESEKSKKKADISAEENDMSKIRKLWRQASRHLNGVIAPASGRTAFLCALGGENSMALSGIMKNERSGVKADRLAALAYGEQRSGHQGWQ